MTSLNDFNNMYWSIIEKNKILKKELQIKDNMLERLHDTIEDTHATYETIKNEFGQEVADLVNGVTKISVFENQALSNSKAENFVFHRNIPASRKVDTFRNAFLKFK